MGQFGIGQPVRRFEDKRLLSGNGRFQNDVTLPGQAYAYVLRSPHAHAAIRAMDLSSAQAGAGVLAIYTGEDLAAQVDWSFIPLPPSRDQGVPESPRAVSLDGALPPR